MLKVTEALTQMFEVPRVFFTINGNPVSEIVLEGIRLRLQNQEFIESCGQNYIQQECLVLEDKEAAAALFESGISPDSAVVLFDHRFGSKRFSCTSITRFKNAIPSWARGARWGVKIGLACRERNALRNCSEQLAANFNRNFQKRLFQGEFPWGPPKLNENPPVNVNISKETYELTKRLNQDPDLLV